MRLAKLETHVRSRQPSLEVAPERIPDEGCTQSSSVPIKAHQRPSETIRQPSFEVAHGRRAERIHSEEELARFLETSARVRAVGALERGLVMLVLFLEALRARIHGRHMAPSVPIIRNQWHSMAHPVARRGLLTCLRAT